MGWGSFSHVTQYPDAGIILARYLLGNAFHKKALRNPWLSRVLWALDYLLIRLLQGLLRALPVEQASRTGNRLGRWLTPLMGRKNDHIRRNLEMAMPDKSADEIERMIPAVWGNAGAVLAEYPHLARFANPVSGRIETVIRKPIPIYSDPTKQAIFVTAHLANWELVAAAICNFNVPCLALYTPPVNPWLDRMLLDSRAALGCQLLSRNNNLRPFIKAIENGCSLAMVMDRTANKGPEIPFFGAPKPSSTLAARLALRFDCPLVPVQTERLGAGRYRVTFHPPLNVSPSVKNLDDKSFDLTHQIHRHFEQWIRSAPQDWFCSKKIWRKDILVPESGKSLHGESNLKNDR